MCLLMLIYCLWFLLLMLLISRHLVTFQVEYPADAPTNNFTQLPVKPLKAFSNFSK